MIVTVRLGNGREILARFSDLELEVLECMRPRPAGRKSVPQQRHAFLSRIDQRQHACRLSQLDDLVWIVRSRHPKAISPIEAKRNQPHLTQILTAPRRRV